MHLGETVNTDADDYVVYVSPDESFMILRRSGGQDRADKGLYICYMDEARGWTRARSMGDHIDILNVFDASVSPDGKYLFLLSKGNGVYWLKADIIEYLKHENLEISDLLLDTASKRGLAAALLVYMDLKEKHRVFVDIDEFLLNQKGHRLLACGGKSEALLLFQILVELFPDSWNAYDSLGEAYLASGQITSAVQSYEKSLELNPLNENAVEALKHIAEILQH